MEEESAIGMVHNHSPSEKIITRTHDATECDAENCMLGLILQRPNPNLNRKHMGCSIHNAYARLAG